MFVDSSSRQNKPENNFWTSCILVHEFSLFREQTALLFSFMSVCETLIGSDFCSGSAGMGKAATLTEAQAFLSCGFLRARLLSAPRVLVGKI
jgi:hypothetical protein